MTDADDTPPIRTPAQPADANGSLRARTSSTSRPSSTSSTSRSSPPPSYPAALNQRAPGIEDTLLAEQRPPASPSSRSAMGSEQTLALQGDEPTLIGASADGAAPKTDLRRDIPARIGRYLVIGPLGEGGMGLVFAAYDPQLDRKVAIKLVRPAYTESSGGLSLAAVLLSGCHSPEYEIYHEQQEQFASNGSGSSGNLETTTGDATPTSTGGLGSEGADATSDTSDAIDTAAMSGSATDSATDTGEASDTEDSPPVGEPDKPVIISIELPAKVYTAGPVPLAVQADHTGSVSVTLDGADAGELIAAGGGLFTGALPVLGATDNGEHEVEVIAKQGPYEDSRIAGFSVSTPAPGTEAWSFPGPDGSRTNRVAVTLDLGKHPADQIGALKDLVKLKLQPSINYVDMAVASTNSNLTSPQLNCIGAISSTYINPSVGMLLRKVGKMTNYTHAARIDTIATSVVIDFGIGLLKFEGISKVDNTPTFVMFGDSGSIALKESTTSPVGMMIAGSGVVGILVPMSTMFNTPFFYSGVKLLQIVV